MFVLVSTQYYENYADDPSQGSYWKAKGGFSYVVPVPFGKANPQALNELKKAAARFVSYSNESAQEYAGAGRIINTLDDFPEWDRPRRLSYREVMAS